MAVLGDYISFIWAELFVAAGAIISAVTWLRYASVVVVVVAIIMIMAMTMIVFMIVVPVMRMIALVVGMAGYVPRFVFRRSNEIHGSIASVVLMAVLAPIFCMPRRHV